MIEDIRIQLTENKKAKPEGALGFGKYFTDHMFIMNYTEGKGWHDARIVPYGPIPLEPTAMVFHYAQEIFEGMKAYRTPDGRTQLFRPEKNAQRFNNSAVRMGMPTIPEEDFIHAIMELVKVDADWIPTAEASSLYIRPFMIATEQALGVHASNSYLFIVVLSPVGSYFPEGFKPIKIYVEDKYIRAAHGGTGFTKCGGNYAASILAQTEAKKKGYSQVLWLDGNERRYVEEVGAMNMMFQIDDELITAPLDGTILPGVTRDSCIAWLKAHGYKVSERKLSIDELVAAGRSGRLVDAFGMGTAAVIAPVGEIAYKDEVFTLNGFGVGETAVKLYEGITGIQWGKLPDNYGWTVEVK